MRKLLAVIAFLFLLLSTIYVEAANRFLTCVTACTITAADTSIWGTTSGGVGASVPGASDAVILDAATCAGGVTCTATMGAAYNPTWQSITMGACTATTTGCILDFSANNNNITLNAVGGFSGTGSGTRTLNMGNGTWTLSNAGGVFTIATSTNLTFNANSSTLSFTGTGNRQISPSGKTFNIVSVGAGVTGSAVSSFQVAQAGTFTTFNVTAPNYLTFSGGATLTVTNAFTWVGSSSSPLGLASNGATLSATIAAAASSSMSWAGIRDMTFTGSPTASSSLDLGHNSGITITPPASGGGGIIGGWLLRRDLAPVANDNSPAFLNVAA